MGTQVTLVYSVTAIGQTPAIMKPFVANAPIPPDVLAALGLRVISDVTGVLNPIVRTIVLGFDPSAAALTAPPVITNTGNFESVAVDLANPGLDFILPPIVRVNNNARVPSPPRATQTDALLRSFLNVRQTHLDLAGTGYVAPVTVAFLGGLPPAGRHFDARKGGRGGCVRYVNVKNPGRGYPAGSTVTIQGGGPTGATPAIPAQATLVLTPSGVIQSIVITDMGSGYVSVPQVIITTPAGSARPAVIAGCFAVMAEGRPAQGTAVINAAPPHVLTGITVTDPGDNYVSVPDILITGVGGGSGAAFTAQMALGRIDVISQGKGYLPGTTVSITSAFKDAFPDVPGDPQVQAQAFFRFLEETIGLVALTPVDSTTPLVA
jgi:hypothetical protein